MHDETKRFFVLSLVLRKLLLSGIAALRDASLLKRKVELVQERSNTAGPRAR